jgi:hypothetical protein
VWRADCAVRRTQTKALHAETAALHAEIEAIKALLTKP